MKKAIELKNMIQEALKRFENLNIVDLETVEKAKQISEANETVRSLVKTHTNAIDENDMNKPGTSKSKENIELSEREKKKQQMLKVKSYFLCQKLRVNENMTKKF